MGEEVVGGVTEEEDANALEEANAGKFGRPSVHPDQAIEHLGALRDYTDMGPRQIEGVARCAYGRRARPPIRRCRRLNSMGVSDSDGAYIICDRGRTFILATDSTGLGMTKGNGWRHQKHGGKRGCM